MGQVIVDARTGDAQHITSDFRGDTSARAASRMYYKSRDEGDAFAAVSHDATGAADTYIIYFKNTSPTKEFVVEEVHVECVEATLFKLWFVTGTAAGGSVIVAVNLNNTKGNAAEATVRGDDAITGLTVAGTEISTVRVGAIGNDELATHGAVILGNGGAIAVEVDTDDGTPGIVGASIIGYYDIP